MLGPLSLAGRDAAESIRQASFFAPSAGAPAISLTDAAEEMAQFFSQARLQERSLKERHLATYESPALRRVEEVEALLQVIWADPKNKGNGDAEQLASRLLAFAGNPEALDRTLKQVNGSTEQFLLLSKALAQGALQGHGNPALESLRDRVDALWARDGVRIRADVNIVPRLADAEDKGAKDRQAGSAAWGTSDLGDLPVRLTFDLGERHLTLRELAEMGAGHVFDLGLPPRGSVNLRVNGLRVGEGEIVEIDGRLGVAVTRILPPRA